MTTAANHIVADTVADDKVWPGLLQTKEYGQ
jgi:hypothetical protein